MRSESINWFEYILLGVIILLIIIAFALRIQVLDLKNKLDNKYAVTIKDLSFLDNDFIISDDTYMVIIKRIKIDKGDK